MFPVEKPEVEMIPHSLDALLKAKWFPHGFILPA
jgi:hypothetical protein